MESEDINSDMINPWSCQSLYDYLYFCCPECESKCQMKQDFVNHAILEHPVSLSFFKKIDDNSIDDVSFPNNTFEDDDIDMKESEIDIKNEIVEVPEKIVIHRPPTPTIKDEKPTEEELTCKACDFIANCEENLKLHHNLYHKKCPECPELFLKKKEVEAHVRKCHKKKSYPYKCLEPNCSEGYGNKNHLVDHMKIVHKKSINKKTLTKDEGPKIEEPSPQKRLDNLMKKYSSVSSDGKVILKTTKEGYQKLQAELKELRELIDKQKEDEAFHELKDEPEDVLKQDMNCDDPTEEDDFEEQNREIVIPPKTKKFGNKVKNSAPKLCVTCGETFTMTKSLRIHEWNKHGITDESITELIENLKIQCEQCQEMFEDTSKLNDHALKCGKDVKTIPCCETEWVAGYTLLVHMKLDHGRLNAVVCDICGNCLTSQKLLEQHMKTIHEKLTDFMCDTCGKGFAIESQLRNHMQLKHAPAKFPCDYFGKKFKSVTIKKIHENSIHTKAVEYPCKYCEKVFYAKSGLRTHRKQVHEKDKYNNKSCPHCDFKAFSIDKLKKHINSIHNSETEYSCNLCQTFVCKGQYLMREHMKNIHNQSATSFKPKFKKALSNDAFSCSECDFKTNYKQNIKKHMAAVHCGVKDQKTKFQCDMCEYSTFREDNLKLHRNYKHFNKPKPFPCQNCDRRFESRRDLGKHLTHCFNIAN